MCGSIPYLLQEIEVKNVIIGKQFEDSENYQEFVKIVKENKVKVQVVEAGETIEIERNLYFDILWPNSKNVISENSLNNNSLVCKMIYGNFSMLFTGDIEKIAEDKIVEVYKSQKQKLNATVLKVAHHRFEDIYNTRFFKIGEPKISSYWSGREKYIWTP